MNRHLFHASITASFLVLALHATPASAALIQVNAPDTGAYQTSGNRDAALQNYIAGQSMGEHRSFFVFDLTSVSAPITAATLNLWNPNTNPHPCCQGYRRDQFLFGFSTTSFAGGDVRRLDLTTTDVPEVPEPASLALLALGLVGLGGRMRQRNVKM